MNTSGSQRCRCKSCQCNFTPDPFPHGYPAQVKQAAIAMAMDGQNFRRIGRNLKVNHQSVANWVKEAGQNALAAATPQPVTNADAVVELDELFPFVQHKKTKSTSSRKSTAKRVVS